MFVIHFCPYLGILYEVYDIVKILHSLKSQATGRSKRHDPNFGMSAKRQTFGLEIWLTSRRDIVDTVMYHQTSEVFNTARSLNVKNA
ncbi:hypothetical protein M8J76_010971 [Diaphorina citri]|nr:hypothetical protein M8J76_010971 [Diaphorina citri]